MGTDSFIAYIKADDIYVDIAKDFKARFDTSKYEIETPSPSQNKKSNWTNER